MMKHLFEVGEIVILQSPKLPEYNGEYTIHAIVETGCNFTCRLTGLLIWTNQGVSYILDEPLLDLIDYGEGCEVFWAPTSLKKKHTGSDFSFTELVNHLQTKIVEKI